MKILVALAAPIIWVLCISVGCALYEGLRPEDFATLDDLSLNFSYSLVGFALSLLLVFKTNVSYARFWEGALRSPLSRLDLLHGLSALISCMELPDRRCEHAARTAWTAVYTECRMFVARAQSYSPEMPIPMRRLIMRWVIALPYLLRSHLLDYQPGSDSVEELLRPEEVRLRHSSIAPARCVL